ncbi:MAG: hypothetical protein H0V12_06590 [Chloroflexi bacterium]|nr:hypothetical protein [Chloroflexota bacterium]
MTDADEPEDPRHQKDLTDVRASMRAEFRAERRSTEAEAIHDMWTRRTLSDAVAEAMRRGDRVAIHLHPGHNVEGVIVDAGRDYAVVETPRQRLAVRVAAATRDAVVDPYEGPQLLIEVRERIPAGGAEASKPSSTFRAVLQRYEFEQQLDERRWAEVGTTRRIDPLTARLLALAADHLYVRDRDDVELFIPTSAITYITWADAGT